MAILYIIAIAAFGAVLSLLEVPKMMRQGLYRETAVFFILLLAGAAAAVLKVLDVKLFNPSDLSTWIFSPLEEFMKSVYK